MSKSDENEKGSIFLTDSTEQIISKVKRAVTDSGSEVRYDIVNKPGIANLMSLYQIATGFSYKQIESDFDGLGYGEFKPKVAKAVADYIAPIRESYLSLRKDETKLKEILTKGAENARKQAFKTLRKVYKKIGFVQF